MSCPVRFARRVSRRVCVLLSPPRSIIAVAASAVISACGGDSGTTEPPPPPPPPISVALTPTTATVNAGGTAEFSATVANTTNTAINWTASGGQVVPNGASATWTAPGRGGSYTITATSAADAARSATATVTVNPAVVVVAPATATIGAGDVVPLTATVTNAVNGAVTWSATGGTIVGTGASVQWTAPVTGGSYTVTARSVLDSTRTGSATVTVTPVTVAVAATLPTLFRGESTTLTATVGGTSERSVTWTASCGSIAGSGASVQFTAPTTAGTCTVQATSVRDPATRGDRVLTVRKAWRVAALNDVDDGACTFQHCSLREAFGAANADPDRDSIIVISGAAPATITLTASLPFLSTAVDLVGPGSSTLTIDAAATVTAPRGVLYANGEFTASVRGVTLRGGRRAGGGGLVIDNKADVTLRDVHIRENTSTETPGGGVLVLRGGRGTFVDVNITGNRATGANGPGGGISIEAGSLVSMVRGRVSDNESVNAFGGGVRVFNSAIVLDSTLLEGNRAVATTGTGLGGGLFADGPQATVQLVNATVRANRAGIAGGGLVIRGGTTATVTGTTVRDNDATTAGGIETGSSSVTLVDSHISDNTAATRGGGVLVFGTGVWTHTRGSIRANVVTSQGGGGLYAQEEARVTLTDVAVEANDGGATSGGGLWLGNSVGFTMRGGSLARNRTGTVGGGLFLNSTRSFTMEQVQVEGNRSVTGGGGVFLGGTPTGAITGGRFADNVTTTGAGGGLFVGSGTLVVTGTSFLRNSAPTAGGGALQAATAGTYTLQNVIADENDSNLGGAFGFQGTMTVTIEGGRLRANRSNTVGGGLWKAGQVTLTMTGTEVLDNVAGNQGGGLQLVGPGAPATLRRLVVRGNSAAASGGGVTAGVTTLIEHSTFSGNTTTAIGGGLFAATSGNATVRNSTFSGNSAVVGGGIAATGPGTITNVTIVGNSSTDYGAGLGVNNAGALTVSNVLLSGNRVGEVPGNCGRGPTSATPIASSGGNLSSDTTCTTFTLPSDKPNTGAGVNATLASNGGPTFTHALLEGSAAINAGVASACPATDQRGFSRVGVCDIGAFEFGGQAPASAQLVGPRATAVQGPAGSRRQNR